MIRRHQAYGLHSLRTKLLLNFLFRGRVRHLGDAQDKDEL